MSTWIDGAADVLARKHALQVGFVMNWLVEQHVTADMIERYYKMSSGDFLDVLFS